MKTKQKTNSKNSGFWNGEKCEYCQGEIIERVTEFTKKSGKEYILIKNVPTGVCKECGVRYYSANVLKHIQQVSKRKPDNEVRMPVYSIS